MYTNTTKGKMPTHKILYALHKILAKEVFAILFENHYFPNVLGGRGFSLNNTW